MMDKEAQDLPAGLMLDGKFKIENCLGRGGMGEVYRARQVAVGRTVAIKVLHAALCTDRGLVARFREEMRTTTLAEHPNIVRVYDVGQSAGRLYLAMEYLDGPTLRKVMSANQRLPLERVRNIAIQIANALGAAHSHGVVHRDLKPDNILLLDVYGNHEFVKVVDFGIARSLESARPQVTADGTILGTPGYLAPEQVLGKPIDERTDLYALGTILFEMLAGALPFAGSTSVGLMMASALADPPSIVDAVPTLPPGVANLVMSMLAREPNERPATAKAVVEALEAWPHAGAPESLSNMASAPRVPATAVLPAAFAEPGSSVPPSAPIPLASPSDPVPRVARTVVLAEPPPEGERPPTSAPRPPTTPPSRSDPSSKVAPVSSRVVVTQSGGSGPKTLSTKVWVKPVLVLALLGVAVLVAAIAGIVRLLK